MPTDSELNTGRAANSSLYTGLWFYWTTTVNSINNGSYNSAIRAAWNPTFSRYWGCGVTSDTECDGFNEYGNYWTGSYDQIHPLNGIGFIPMASRCVTNN